LHPILAVHRSAFFLVNAFFGKNAQSERFFVVLRTSFTNMVNAFFSFEIHTSIFPTNEANHTCKGNALLLSIFAFHDSLISPAREDFPSTFLVNAFSLVNAPIYGEVICDEHFW